MEQTNHKLCIERLEEHQSKADDKVDPKMNHSLYTYLFEDQGANVVPFLVSFPC